MNQHCTLYISVSNKLRLSNNSLLGTCTLHRVVLMVRTVTLTYGHLNDNAHSLTNVRYFIEGHMKHLLHDWPCDFSETFHEP